MFFMDERINNSIKILKTYEPKEGYYLAFSGGKDSVVLYDLAKKSRVKFDAHYQITTADPPEVVRFIRDFYPFVAMEKPKITMWKLIPKKLMPPTRKVRYCCEKLKERGGEGRIILTGVKRSDSRNRKDRHVKVCRERGKIIINPLLDWCDDEIWSYIRNNKLPYCSLYDNGFKRLGCIGCPLASIKQREKEFRLYPKYKQVYLRAFENMLKERKRQGKKTKWKTSEEVMRWWMSQ